MEIEKIRTLYSCDGLDDRLSTVGVSAEETPQELSVRDPRGGPNLTLEGAEYSFAFGLEPILREHRVQQHVTHDCQCRVDVLGQHSRRDGRPIGTGERGKRRAHEVDRLRDTLPRSGFRAPGEHGGRQIGKTLFPLRFGGRAARNECSYADDR